MKKPVVIILISFQLITMLGIAATAYFTFMNKARIQATQRVLVDTQERLTSTFVFMDEMQAMKDQQEEMERPLRPGMQAPNFALQNELAQEVSLTDYRGKKVLMVFSQEACPYCQDFYPVLNQFSEQHNDVEVVVMQLQSTPEQNKAYKAQQNINATVLAATADELLAYKVKSTPTSVLIDENGTLLGTGQVLELADLVSFVQKNVNNQKAG